jgi:hypothetical protein
MSSAQQPASEVAPSVFEFAPGLFITGQLDSAALGEALKITGARTLINIRSPAEGTVPVFFFFFFFFFFFLPLVHLCSKPHCGEPLSLLTFILIFNILTIIIVVIIPCISHTQLPTR